MRRVFVLSVSLLVYTFVGYPALVATLARVRPRPARRDESIRPEVTLVISAFNEASCIEQKLDNCGELEYPRDRLEVIVVADGSDDGTERVAARPDVSVLFEPTRRGKAAAMARGVEAARGEIVVFSDANNLYLPATLRALVAPFADPTVGIVTGRKLIDAEDGRLLDRSEDLYWRYEAAIRRWESTVGSTTGVVGEALAVRRAAYVPPPPGTVLDDFVLATSVALAGWRVVYAPDAVSYERASATLADEETRRSKLITGRLQALGRVLPRLIVRRPFFACQLVSHKGLRLVVPYVALAAAASSFGQARRSRVARLFVLGEVLLLLAALVGWRAERGGRSRLLAFYLPYYFVRMNVAAIRGALELRKRRDHTLWTRVRRG